MRRYGLLLASILAMIACAALVAGTPPGGAVPPGPRPAEATKPSAETAALPPGLPEGWYTRIETGMGVIVARLLPDQAPQSVAHFAALAEGRLPWTDPNSGQTQQGRYYDGVRVYKAVAAERFEIADRSGGGHGFPPFFVPPEEGTGPANFSKPGRLGMTASTLGRTSGVKFFVTAGTLPWLNLHNPCFGEVVEGQDVVWRICEVKTHPNGRPIDPVEILQVRIVKVGSPPPLPEPKPYTPKAKEFLLKDGVGDNPR